MAISAVIPPSPMSAVPCQNTERISKSEVIWRLRTIATQAYIVCGSFQQIPGRVFIYLFVLDTKQQSAWTSKNSHMDNSFLEERHNKSE